MKSTLSIEIDLWANSSICSLKANRKDRAKDGLNGSVYNGPVKNLDTDDQWIVATRY